MKYPSQQAHWEAWERGEDRCPLCWDLDERDFEACCDCSRWSWEHNGHGISIGVVGTNISVPVKPYTFNPSATSDT